MSLGLYYVYSSFNKWNLLILALYLLHNLKFMLFMNILAFIWTTNHSRLILILSSFTSSLFTCSSLFNIYIYILVFLHIIILSSFTSSLFTCSSLFNIYIYILVFLHILILSSFTSSLFTCSSLFNICIYILVLINILILSSFTFLSSFISLSCPHLHFHSYSIHSQNYFKYYTTV